MPRKAKPLSISEDDLTVLQRLQASEDASISLRAKIILLSTEYPEKQDKDIAEDLKTTPQTVLKWKSAYRTSGINGLIPLKRGRRSAVPDGENLSVKIQELLDSDPEKDWTAQEIATVLGVTKDKVYTSLRTQGITLNRNRCWICTTKEDSYWDTEAFIGLYLSHTDQVFLLGDIPSPLSGYTICGAMETHNRSLYEEAERSAIPLTMLDSIVHAAEYPEKSRRSQEKTASVLISGVLREWGDGRSSRIHIFIHGKDLYRDAPDTNVLFHRAESFESLKGELLNWSLNTLGSDGVAYMARVLTAASEYRANCEEDTEPYVWKLPYDGCKKDTTPSPAADLPIAESYASIEDVLHGLFPEGDDTHTEMNKAILVHRSTDGTIEYRVIDQSYEKAIEGDFRTMEGFDQVITSLDDVMTLFARDINIAGRDFFMGLVKKKREH